MYPSDPSPLFLRPVPAEGGGDREWLAHDVRNALQGVLGGVLQLEGADMPADVQVQLDRIAASAKALGHFVAALVGDCPELQDAGEAPVDLQRFLRNLRLRWSGEAHQARVNLLIEAAGDAPRGLYVDLIALVRILGNLISNGIRHANAANGTAMVRLTVGAGLQGGVEFRVADNGRGMSEAALARVLAAGYRPCAAERPAHGLGLSIVKSLTEEEGGSFALANRPGGGLDAVVRFPPILCAVGEGAAGESAQATRRPDLRGARILLAEDNPTNQMVATQMLQALNARVTLTCDGVEALERFEAESFDLLVVDIEMPRLSGLDVIRAVRSRADARAHVPIVALTAYALREHRDRIAEAGANGLISKPITSIDALGRTLLAHVAPERGPAEPSVGGVEPPQSVVNRAIYDALCAAVGPEVMAELLEKVVADLGTSRAALARALATADRKLVRTTSHILISVAGAVGATRLQSCAQALNAAAHGEDEETIARQISFCLMELDAAIEFVESRRAAG